MLVQTSLIPHKAATVYYSGHGGHMQRETDLVLLGALDAHAALVTF